MSNQNFSLEVTIARDFLEKFSRTKSISAYSPGSAQISGRCRMLYPKEHGGKYDLTSVHVLAAARSLKIRISRAGQIAISAEEFNHNEGASFRDDLVCRHGYTPYTYIYDGHSSPKIFPLCARCAGGLERPTESEILQAVEVLIRGEATVGSPPGAIVLAAKRLGYQVKAGKLLKIAKPKNLTMLLENGRSALNRSTI